MTLCTERIRTLDDIRAFLGGNEAADITPHDREAAYAFIERALVRFNVPLRPVEGREGPGEGVPRQGHRLLGLPAEPADRAAAPHGPDPRPPAASSRPALRDGVHDRRRGAAGRGGRGLRPAVGTGDEEGPVAHVPCLRRRALQALGGDFERSCPKRSWRLRWLPVDSCYAATSSPSTGGVPSSSRCALRIQRSL